jgi:AcrR family transcriptional regulator
VPKAETGARERKKRQTRGRIQDAAFRLFSDAGFDTTTVDQIAAAAEVSPRTFFRYFASKEDVVFSDEALDLEALRTAVDAQPAAAPERVALREGILGFSRYLEDDHARVLPRARLVADNQSLMGRTLVTQGEWADKLADGLAQRNGSADPSFEQRVLASAAIGALTTAVMTWAMNPADSLHELTRRALEILSTALA